MGQRHLREIQRFIFADGCGMRDFLKKQKADLKYVEGPGIHDWNFWTPHAYEGIEFLLNNK